MKIAGLFLSILMLCTICSTQTVAGNSGSTPLRNYDYQILQLNFLRNQTLNSSLNDVDEFYLNNRVYGFQWQNGLFTRLPFPANATMNDCDEFRPDFPRVAVPLKNRFRTRPLNSSQMNCPLYFRVIENNHYIGKFNRIGLEFMSPCLDYNLYKYILNKNGLRTTLVLRLFDQTYTFQFRDSVRTMVGKSLAEAYREYRMLNPVHHPVNLVTRKYQSNNSTNNNIFMNNQILNPSQAFAMQVLALEQIRKNYAQKFEIYNQHDQNNTYASRNEAFPRKNMESDSEQESFLRYPDFRFSKKALLKSHRVLLKMYENSDFSTFEKRFKRRIRKMVDDYLLKNGIDKSIFQKLAKARKLQKKLARKRHQHTKFNKISKKRKATEETLLNKVKLSSGLGKKRGRMTQILNDLVNLIMANEPYKVQTCQKICTPSGYYNSWNFCLRVCGINYQFLSNTNDLYGYINLYPNVSFTRIARGFVFLGTTRPNDLMFTYNEIQELKNGVDVVSCMQTWRSLRCSLAVPLITDNR